MAPTVLHRCKWSEDFKVVTLASGGIHRNLHDMLPSELWVCELLGVNSRTSFTYIETFCDLQVTRIIVLWLWFNKKLKLECQEISLGCDGCLSDHPVLLALSTWFWVDDISLLNSNFWDWRLWKYIQLMWKHEICNVKIVIIHIIMKAVNSYEIGIIGTW